MPFDTNQNPEPHAHHPGCKSQQSDEHKHFAEVQSLLREAMPILLLLASAAIIPAGINLFWNR